MNIHKTILVLVLNAISVTVFAKEPPQMRAIAEWAGPFKETVITKYADYSEGVACYVYSPIGISTSINCSKGGCATHFKGDIGSISCVKVIENKKK